jgi:hypothetical protein
MFGHGYEPVTECVFPFFVTIAALDMRVNLFEIKFFVEKQKIIVK